MPSTTRSSTHRRRRLGWRILAAIAALCWLLLAWDQTLLPIAYYSLASRWQPAAAGSSMGLADYRVTLEALPIAGITDNASGLTYSPDSHSLLAIINRPAMLAELTLEGQLLRTLRLPELRDPEDISHIQGPWFAVVDEADNSIHALHLDAKGARTYPIRSASGIKAWHNLGLEGVAWDAQQQRLWLAQEKWPKHIWQLPLTQGTPPQAAAPLHAPHAKGWQSLLGGDLSAIALHPTGGQVLLLSHESALLTEYNHSGEILSLLPLWRGLSGLRRGIPQAEGMTITPDGVIYVLSEPNLLYRLERRPAGDKKTRSQAGFQ